MFSSVIVQRIGNSQIIAVPEIRADAPEFRRILAGVKEFL